MKGDFSRLTFRPERRYTGVRMQQGRVQLDADWNEQIDIQAHGARSALAHVIGAAGGPLGAAAFAVSIADSEGGAPHGPRPVGVRPPGGGGRAPAAPPVGGGGGFFLGGGTHGGGGGAGRGGRRAG